ncbi:MULTISPECIES: MFS transporter [unclassified Acidovorax]|uniref:MFS transporter n=1 Tax=unclassified Acidovorax TaxID=2684926 RepID=UPI002883315B|nr:MULTISPECIES: MFS transporter [unclassified Acidovorax]
MTTSSQRPTLPQTTLPAGAEVGTPAYRRITIALFFAGFATFSLLYCVQPLLPEFARHFQIGAAASSVALSASTAALAVSILVAGVVSQAVGRRWLMFGSMALAALCNLLAGLSPNWATMLAARTLEGVLLGGVPAVAMAYLAEEIDTRGLGFAMGLYIGGTAFGGMVGRVGVGLLTDAFGWRQAMVIVSVIDLLVAIGFVLLLPPSRRFVRAASGGVRQQARIWRDHLRNPVLPLLIAVGCLLVGPLVSVFNLVSFRLSSPVFGLGQAEIGLIFCAYLLGMCASPWAGALADRLGRPVVLIGCVLLMAAGVLLTLPAHLAAMIAGICLITLGFFGGHAVVSGWVGAAALHSKGHASSIYLLAYYMASSVLGVVAGGFWEKGQWPAVVLFCMALLMLALGGAVRLRAAGPHHTRASD